LNLSVSGLPAILVQVVFILLLSAPVWLAAKMVGARHPTLLRAALSLVVGGLGVLASVAFGGAFALFLAPIVFLLSFKYVLGTSVIGSIGLAIIAVVVYAAMVHFIGAAFQVPTQGTTYV
jgi:hypothetical protein